jgi:HlyD family secretion protein
MKKRIRIIAPVVVIIGAVLAWALFSHNGGASDVIRLSGNIDVTQVDLSFKIAGRLAARPVDEGDWLQHGDLVGQLDDTDQRLQVSRAEADLAYSASILTELESGSRPEEIQRAAARVQQSRFALAELERGSRLQEVAQAEAVLARTLAAQASAQSRLELAQAEFERYAAVFKEGGISRQVFDSYRTQRDTAENNHSEAVAQVAASREQLSLVKEGPRREQIRQARAALSQAEADYALVKAGPRVETIAQAQARVDAARQVLKLSQQQLADTRVFAPFDGVVLSKSAEPGAYLPPGSPVLSIARIDKVWLRAFIGEKDLGRIRLGQEAEVFIDAYPDKTYRGRVSFISSQAEFTPKSVQTFEERVNLMYRVKIDLDNPNGELKPGMPADAHIKVAQ